MGGFHFESYGGVLDRLICAVTALLAYEYLLTLTREIALFWKRRLTGASVLFFLNRYIVLALHIFNFAIAGPVSDKVSYQPDSCACWAPQ